ncbi:hypothetical protein CXG81DRAFT_29255 [Caulochytrium protostelioides]|uniref:Tyrosine--tRNA ligase n=1 Tax=Caulochytrium protostelioides TaxID=1555241 RepID=A0A4P9XE90_9FUNG|nr:hypothetical protein CXG81DRAFT_29255 [Caulochytrium protostelioides]|eukprot:RKP03470.1 hypothetical protein CXG81DRAFT_29255 [Caulochytrium protostelioides]
MRLVGLLRRVVQEPHVVADLELPALLAARPTTVYVGFDPSARSLHVGNLMMLVTALVFQCYGHRTLALVGGATGQIGDPSGKHAERPLQNKAAVAENTQHIKDQIAYVMGHARAYAARRCGVEAVPGAWQLVDNARWWSGMGLLDFFRDVGKHMRMGAMISKDAVRSRMATEDGLSLTEFCYQSLQAYDFCHLYEAEQCQVQLGGSDQWGNIIAGIELVKKRDPQYASKPWNERMYGMTLPLLTTETGKKYGKSEGNAVWLDPTMTSPYDLWQFLRRTPDTEVARMLQLFTLVPQEELAAVMQHHAQEPRRGLPQVLLAREVVELVHGADVAAKTQQIVELLHPIGRVLEPLNMDHVVATLQGTTFEIQLPREEILNAPVAKIAVLAGLAPTLSK